MEEDKSGEAKKMSSSVPYIGATMDVVTKSSARYLGVLASINVAESTITLTQGRAGSAFLSARLVGSQHSTSFSPLLRDGGGIVIRSKGGAERRGSA